jgi:hypothetical protein
MLLTSEPLHINRNDVFIAYSNLISETDKQFFFNSEIEGIDEVITKVNRGHYKKKNQIAVYTGKARKVSYCKILLYKIIYGSRIVPITREIPFDKKTLFRILAESKILITYDPLTNIIYESTLCNTPVFVADNYLKVKYRKYNIPLIGIFDRAAFFNKYFIRGIKEKQYHQIVENYTSSVKKHIQTTKELIHHIITEIEKPDGFRASENTLRNKCFEYEFFTNCQENNIYQSKLRSYAPVVDFYTILKIIRLGIINNTIRLICSATCSPKELQKDLRGAIVKHKKSIISSFIEK